MLKTFIKFLFSIKNKKHFKVITILGINFPFKRQAIVSQVEKEILIQNSYNLYSIENASKIVVFLIPAEFKMSGGVMSIFTVCRYSRETSHALTSVLVTYPGYTTYASNDTFSNDEQIYRWKQIVQNAKNAKELIIHVPEYYASDFYHDLDSEDLNFIENMTNVQINIMNQNIERMPEPDKIRPLYKLSTDVTQTVGHHSYATQEVCNRWQLPLMLLPAITNTKVYLPSPWSEKENIIAYSNDQNKNKTAVLKMLANRFSDYQLIEINDMTFDEYMETITKAKYTLTFGEGFDAYLIQPFSVGSIGVAVYNSNFFPTSDFLECANVFDSYENLIENFSQFTLFAEENHLLIVSSFQNKMAALYVFDEYKQKIKNFYNHRMDFYPIL